MAREFFGAPVQYAFGSFQLDGARECVTGPDGVVALRPQTYAVLRLLVERAPALVTHEEILASVWGHSAISDSAVAQTIKELRQAFGDSARDPRYIETRQRRGYRMAAEVRALPDAAGPAPTMAVGPVEPIRASRGGGRLVALLIAGAVLLALALPLAWRGGLSGDEGSDDAAAQMPPPRDAAAQRGYDDGRAALERFDAGAAIEALRLAAERAPEHAGVALALAHAYELAGDSAAAQALADRLAAHADALPKPTRLRLDALSARLRFRWDEAATALAALHAFHPDAATAVALIEAQLAAAEPDAAARTLEALRASHRDDPRTALATAWLAHARHDYAAQHDAASAAAGWAERDGAHALAARARVMAALARLRSGDLQGAVDAARSAQAAAARAGDARSEGDALLLLASAEIERADLPAAEAHAIAAQQAFARVDYRAGAAEAERTLGMIAEQRGALSDALAAYQRASTILEALGDRAGAARVYGAIGTANVRAGNADAALAAFDRARDAYATEGDLRSLAGAWNNRGMLLSRMGRREEAQSAFERALEAFERIDDRRGQAVTLGNLAAGAGQDGQVARAIELNQRALAIFTAIGAEADAARLALNLGLAEQRRGALGEAHVLLLRAVDGFARLGTATYQSAALTALGELERRMGRSDAAADALARAQALEVEDPLRQASVHTLDGRLALAARRHADARAAFERARSLRERAKATGWVLASELDLAELDLAEGHRVEAEQGARTLAQGFHEAGEHTDHAAALRLLAESLWKQDRPDDARRELTAAQQALARAPDAELALRIALLEAQLANHETANERLQWVRRTAAEQGFALLERQAAAAHSSAPPLP